MHGVTAIPRREVELKLAVPPASLPALANLSLLRRSKVQAKPITEVSVYFDTRKHKLAERGLMLRVRRIGNRYVQTIKATKSLNGFGRDEWEAEIAGKEPDLSVAAGTALEPFLTKKLRRQLEPLFETKVKRTSYPVANEARALALEVDEGSIDTGSSSLLLCEIELELQRGKVADLFDVAREVSRAVPAQLVFKSKSERGYGLIDGAQDTPLKAAPPGLWAGMSTCDAFKVIGHACLKQVVGNEAAVIKGDPEGVHQMRVGLRRLRAAMSLFSTILADDQSVTIKAELKWLAGELGPARELEVLISRVIAPIKGRHGFWRHMPALSREVAAKREAALVRAQDAVQSARFRTLTLDVAEWLEAGRWTTPADDLVRDRGDLVIEVSAAEQLARRWRKVRKKGKALAQLRAGERHKLRIQTKKLRYAVEFFGGLFADKRATKRRKWFLAALERLQDGLGDLNDIAVHERRISAMGIRRRRSNVNRAFAAGLLTGREDARTEAAMALATTAHADLLQSKPFWQ